MDYATLKRAVLAVEDNNRTNGARWADWSDASDILHAYGLPLDREVADILGRAVRSDGASLYADCEAAELAEWGSNFSPPWYAHVAGRHETVAATND